jgi:hypothetical protein
MATFDDVRRLALAMPEATEDTSRRGLASWRVNKKLFVWERPLSKTDIAALGEDAPGGDILGARVPDEGAKFALVESDPTVYFTTPHFAGYAAILVTLANIGAPELTELVVEAWLHVAPAKLANAYGEEMT